MSPVAYNLCITLSLVLGPTLLIGGLSEYFTLRNQLRGPMPVTPRALVKDVLRTAYKAVRAGFTTKALARMENGEQCFVNDNRAITWSLVGALQFGELRLAERHGAERAWVAYSTACEIISRQIPGDFNGNILRWGDTISQTQALEVIQRAAGEC